MLLYHGIVLLPFVEANKLRGGYDMVFHGGFHIALASFLIKPKRGDIEGIELEEVAMRAIAGGRAWAAIAGLIPTIRP